VSRKRKAAIGLAGLALAGGACLGGVAAAPVAGAASPACGSSCVSMYNQKFGSADVSAVSGGTAATGQAVTLAAAAPSTTEDWSANFQGAVSDFYAAGLMNAILNEYYGSDMVYEFEYQPGGINSGECLGIASGPGQGTKVTLQQCAKTVNTTWIYDAAAASGGYVPYISGSDTKYPAPYVLTAVQAGGDFTTQALRVNSKGVVAKDQMWQLISGVLGPQIPPAYRLTVPFATQMGSAGNPNNGGNNCGPASITMAILYYGGSTTVPEAAVAIRGTNDRRNGPTDFKSPSSQAFLAKFSLVEHDITTWDQVREEISAGRPVIILVNNKAYRYLTPPPYPNNSSLWFTPAHIIVVTGYDATNVYVNDPLRSSSDYAIPVATFMTAASTATGANSGDWYAVSVARA